jgi:flagellar basal body-associated protein FliL
MDEAAAPVEVPPAKKSGSKLGLIAAVVLLVGAAAAGGLYGGKLMQKPAAAAKHAPEEEGEAAAEEEEAPAKKPTEAPKASAALPALVVDVRDKDGDIHHLKIAISFELGEVPEDEFAKCMPRGREAALIYLRGLSFEQVTDAKQFEKLRKELTEKVAEAVGKKRVKRVLLTDFVAQ